MNYFQFAALAASGADIDIPAFLADMEEDDELDEIDLSPWLSERELAATADYEMTRLKNMKLNYEMLLKLGKYYNHRAATPSNATLSYTHPYTTRITLTQITIPHPHQNMKLNSG